MKLFWFFFVSGSILLFFLVTAFKINLLSLEMLTHSLFHFLIGFVTLSYFFFHMTLKVLKFLSFLLLGLLILDQLIDFSRGVGDISLQLLIMNFYLVFWGGLSGFAFTRFWSAK